MNKYIVVSLLFLIWILFIHEYNLLFFANTKQEIRQLESQKNYYKEEIKKDSTNLYKIKNIKEDQEKFARERFLMKKEGEEIFIIKE